MTVYEFEIQEEWYAGFSLIAAESFSKAVEILKANFGEGYSWDFISDNKYTYTGTEEGMLFGRTWDEIHC